MRAAALVSTGKDSAHAAHLASREHELISLGGMVPASPESYMFHRPTYELLHLFASAADLPIVIEETEGKKEEELDDLKRLLERLKELGAEAVVAGAVESSYQRDRLENLAGEQGMEVIAPLWNMDGEELLHEMLDSGLRAIVIKVAAMGLDESWLGREIDSDAVEELVELRKENRIHVAGEGGEYETLTLDSPLFTRGSIEVEETSFRREGRAAELIVERARLRPYR